MTSEAQLPFTHRVPAPHTSIRTVPDMTGIKDNGDGTFTATVKVNGKKRQRTFASRDAALSWRNRQKGAKERSGATSGSGIRQLSTGRFQVDRNYRGRRLTRKFDTLEEAEGWLVAALDAVDAGLEVPVPGVVAATPAAVTPVPRLVGELMKLWHEERYDKRLANGTLLATTVEDRKRMDRHVIAELGAIQIDSLTHVQVEKLVGKLADAGYAKTTQRDVLWGLSQAYELAKARGWVTSQPAYKVQTQRPKHKSTSAKKVQAPSNRTKAGEAIEVHNLPLGTLRSIARSLHVDDATAMWVERLMGLRVSETFGLRLCDVWLEEGLVLVCGQGGRKFVEHDGEGGLVEAYRVDRTKGPIATGDSASKRVVAIPSCLTPLLSDLVARRVADGATDEDPLFASHRDASKPGSSATFTDRLKKVSRGFMEPGTHLRTHDLRKSFSTDLAIADVPPQTVSVVMGHNVGPYDGQAQVTATTYLKLSGLQNSRLVEKIRSAAAAIDGLVREDLAGQLLVSVEDDEEAEWLPVKEAAERLKVTRKTVEALIASGELEASERLLSEKRRQKCWHVTVASVEAHLAEKDRRPGLQTMCVRFNVDPRTVMAVAGALGIKLVDNRRGKGSGRDFLVFEEADAVRFCQVMKAREEFAEEHLWGTQARELLDITQHQFDSVLRSGLLMPVDPPVPMVAYGTGSGSADWYSRSEVLAIEPQVRRRMKRNGGRSSR